MLFTNPLHETTRRVILPEAWENTPEQVQVNYHSYLDRRLIPSTDVYIGSRLIYRSNALGCRGDDILPDAPILALFGDVYVHGTVDHIPFETFHIQPFQTVNCGIEDISLKVLVDRVVELNDAIPIACAVIVPPRHELAPVPPPLWEGSFYGPPCAEQEWRAELDRLPADLDITFLLPSDMPSWPDKGLAMRMARFIQAYGTEKGYRVLDARNIQPAPPPRAGRRAQLRALLLRLADAVAPAPLPAPSPASGVMALLKGQLAPRNAQVAIAPKVANPGPSTALDPAGHGPTDTGKNYPLW